jgi:hypothetical protein
LPDSVVDGRPVKHFRTDDGHDIYFPLDGRQPTAAEAVRWSGANVKSGAVTDWFLMMFGLKMSEGKFLQYGFDEGGDPGRIMSFDANMDIDLEDDLKTATTCSTRQELFLKEFAETASTSVGRVLLYRLLLEIRRKTIADDGTLVNYLESGVPISNDMLRFRNGRRSIIIKWGKEKSKNQFDVENRTVEFFLQQKISDQNSPNSRQGTRKFKPRTEMRKKTGQCRFGP